REDLGDLYLNLQDQIGELARRRGGLRGVLHIPRGRRPRTNDGYFEHLTWTVFKSGISSAVVNRKWRGFRRAFAGFSARKVAAFGARDVTRLVKDPGIIRYRAKIEATIDNAGEMLAILEAFGSFHRYLRHFPLQAQGRLYDDLRRRFRHLGPYGVRTFLRRVGEDVFFAYPDTLRVLYRLGLIDSPRAADDEVGRAHALIVDANPGSRLDEVNRLLTRHGSGYELDEAICDDSPKCYRCALSHWCWYYHEVRGLANGDAVASQDLKRIRDR
ncbi:MAG: DNA-3-methyladenine glycosylase I, partial [bacterium]